MEVETISEIIKIDVKFNKLLICKYKFCLLSWVNKDVKVGFNDIFHKTFQ